MSKIRVLDQHIADKIAAGEVVKDLTGVRND